MAGSKDSAVWKYALVGTIAFIAGRGSTVDSPVGAPPVVPPAQEQFEPPSGDAMRPTGGEAAPEPLPPIVPEAPVYFANCSEARAAGAAPVVYDDPGYAPHLDRDRDGIGCE